MSSTSAFDDFADDFLAERTPRLMIIVGASKVDALLYGKRPVNPSSACF
jgi:hypothetical protein